MGIIISRFRRKLTSLEELEKIEEEIQDIEKYKQETEQRQKKIVGKLVVYSVGVYVIAAAVFYFLFFPASLRDRLFYIIPLLLFPVIVIFLKKLISWYYVKRMREQQDLLRRLRTDKRQLLEQVMEKETFKVARNILEKFAPDQLRNNNKLGPNTPSNLPIAKPVTNSSSTALVPVSNNSLVTRPMLPSAGTELRQRATITTQLQQALSPASPVQTLQPGLPRIRPVLPKESGVLDRLIETLVGDGPSWRYALICAHCQGHNGMALREEFPFLAFRCCYCSFFNHAKKQRPLSPRLLDKEEQRHETSSDSDPDSETRTSENEETQLENKDCTDQSGGVTSSPETTVENNDDVDNKSPEKEHTEMTEPLNKDDFKVD